MIHKDGLLLFRRAMFLTVVGIVTRRQTSTDPWSILVQSATVEEGKTNVYSQDRLVRSVAKGLERADGSTRIVLIWWIGVWWVRREEGSLICGCIVWDGTTALHGCWMSAVGHVLDWARRWHYARSGISWSGWHWNQRSERRNSPRKDLSGTERRGQWQWRVVQSQTDVLGRCAHVFG